MSVVQQQFVQYHLSLRDNITISDIERRHDDEGIVRTLECAGISETHAFMEQIDNELGREFGKLEISGGQWQKLAIARALFRRTAEVIFFDEPTAALDPLIESDIIKNFLMR